MDYLARLTSRREGLLSEVRSSLDAAAEADLDLTDDESEKSKPATPKSAPLTSKSSSSRTWPLAK